MPAPACRGAECARPGRCTARVRRARSRHCRGTAAAPASAAAAQIRAPGCRAAARPLPAASHSLGVSDTARVDNVSARGKPCLWQAEPRVDGPCLPCSAGVPTSGCVACMGWPTMHCLPLPLPRPCLSTALSTLDMAAASAPHQAGLRSRAGRQLCKGCLDARAARLRCPAGQTEWLPRSISELSCSQQARNASAGESALGRLIWPVPDRQGCCARCAPACFAAKHSPTPRFEAIEQAPCPASRRRARPGPSRL